MRNDDAYLIPQCTHQVLYRLAIVFAELADIVEEDLVKAALPVVPHDAMCPLFELDQVWIARVTAHDLEPVRGVLQERESPPGVPEEGVNEAGACVGSVSNQKRERGLINMGQGGDNVKGVRTVSKDLGLTY